MGGFEESGARVMYQCDNCGSGVNGNHIDVFFNDHQAARVFGVQSAMVYLEGDHDVPMR